MNLELTLLRTERRPVPLRPSANVCTFPLRRPIPAAGSSRPATQPADWVAWLTTGTLPPAG